MKKELLNSPTDGHIIIAGNCNTAKSNLPDVGWIAGKPMPNQQNELNSYTNGNLVTAMNTTNIGQLSGPDTLAGYNTFMQQSSTIYKMPPDPRSGNMASKAIPKPMQSQHKHGDCNCK